MNRKYDIDLSKIKIRSAIKEDFDEVFKLLQQLWSDRKLEKDRLMGSFEHGIISPNDIYLCAEIGGHVLGFCSFSIKNSLWQEANVGHVSELIVDSTLRNQGIGTALIRAAIDIAKARGCKRIELDSAFHRKEAHKLYEKLGFEKRAYLFSKEL